MSETSSGVQSPNMVVGVFSTLAGASEAVNRLRATGLTSEHISVISSNDVVKQHFKQYRPDAEPDDWKDAAVFGGATGAVLAGLTSVVALATGAGIPFIVAGGLASFLTGGIVGGLAGAMVERGFETEAADYYEFAVAQGKTLVIADLGNDEAMPATRAAVEQTFLDAGSEPIDLHKNPDFASK